MRRYLFTLTLLCAVVCAGVACSDDDDTPSKVYRVGEFYSVGGVKGVVFALEQGGRHGLVVSLDQTTAQWATEAAAAVVTHADDLDDGEDNMEEIQRIANWQTKFPAFAWCAAKNTGGVRGWVLPAYLELFELYTVWSADKQVFNKILTDNGGTPIEVSTAADPAYWSSTEYGTRLVATDAYSYEFFDGRQDFPLKTGMGRVRAVYEF